MSWRTGDGSAFGDALAVRLRAVAADLGPPPALQSSLRTMLMAEAAVALTATPTIARPRAIARQFSLPSLTRRRTTAIGAVAASTFAFVGMTAASASALPGDALYAVKRGVEGARLAMHLDDSDRGAFRLELAGERLRETHGLTERRSVPPAVEADTVEDYSEQAELGSDALVRSFKQDHRRADIITINQFANQAAGQLERLEGKLEGPAAEALEAAQAQLTAIVATSTAACPACGGLHASLKPQPPAPTAPERDPQQDVAPTPDPVTGPPSPSVAVPSAPRDEDETETETDDDEADDESASDSDDPRPRLSPSPSPTPSPLPSPTPSPTPTPAAPKADFSWTGSRPGQGNELRIDFEDASSADATTWTWNFGDGATSSEQNPQHKYDAAGTYAVTLTVSNHAGATGSVTKNVTVPIP